MKIELLTPFRYFGASSASMPSSPDDCDYDRDRDLVRKSFELGMQQCEAGQEAGFDSLNVTEHHYSSGQMSAAPHLIVAALGQRLPSAQFAIYGTPLLRHNPVEVAEQYAILDNLLIPEQSGEINP